MTQATQTRKSPSIKTTDKKYRQRGARLSPEDMATLKTLSSILGVSVRKLIKRAVLEHLSRCQFDAYKHGGPPKRAQWGTKKGWESQNVELSHTESDLLDAIAYGKSIFPADFIEMSVHVLIAGHQKLLEGSEK